MLHFVLFLGQYLSNAFVNSGITTFEMFERTDPREIEMVIMIFFLCFFSLFENELLAFSMLFIKIMIDIVIQHMTWIFCSFLVTPSALTSCYIVISKQEDDSVLGQSGSMGV